MVGRWPQLRFHRVSSRRENRPGFYPPTHPTELNAFRNAVKTGTVSLHCTPPERAERVSKRDENRRLESQDRSQEPIGMGSWLFPSSLCNFTSYEFSTHPGAQIWGVCDG